MSRVRDFSLWISFASVDFSFVRNFVTICDVKQIIAIIKPFLADKVLAELQDAPLEALQVHSVKGYGRQKNYLDQYTESEYSHAFLPKVEIRMWVQDSRADEVLDLVSKSARTGRIGDGKILVLPVLRCETIIEF